MTYEEIADRVAVRVLREVIYLYRPEGVVVKDKELMDDEDYQEIFDIVFGELVEQDETE